VFASQHGVTSQKTLIFSKTAARTPNPVANVYQPKEQLSIAVSSIATDGLPNPFSITRNDVSNLLPVEDLIVVVFIDYTVLSSSLIVMACHISVIMWHRVTGLCHLSNRADDTAMTRSVCYQLPGDAASHPNRTDTSTVVVRRRLPPFCEDLPFSVLSVVGERILIVPY
jgi:hypothetical protein